MTRAALPHPKRLPSLPRIANPRRAPLFICRAQTLSRPTVNVKFRRLRAPMPFMASPEPENPLLVALATLSRKPTPAFKSP